MPPVNPSSAHISPADQTPVNRNPVVHQRGLLDRILPGNGPNPSLNESKSASMRKPPDATSPWRSILFAIGGFCGGALSGTGLGFLFWSGLKDHFSSGVDASANVGGVGGELGGLKFGFPTALDSDLSVAADLGGAPVKVIVTVALVFGVVVGAFSWLIERQLAGAADRRHMMSQLDNLTHNNTHAV